MVLTQSGQPDRRRHAQQMGVAGYALAMNYNPPEVDRIWGIWGSLYNIPKAIFYLLNGDYRSMRCMAV